MADTRQTDVGRDPKRIPRVLEQVRLAWERYPDWRLGQLVVNASRPRDPFYVGDGEIEDDLRQLAADLGHAGGRLVSD